MKINLQARLWEMERGEMMIESMLVLIPILFVLVFLLSLGFFFYQHWNIQITANEVATKVAESYPYLDTDVGKGVSNYSQVQSVDKYRYLKLFGKDKYEEDNKTRGKTYGKKYLSLVSLAYAQGEPNIEIEVVEDAFACRHIHTTVNGKYKLPFGEGFEIFGMKSEYAYSADGYAICTDMSDYLGSINYAANLEGILGLNKISVYKTANSIMGMIKKIASAINKAKD